MALFLCHNFNVLNVLALRKTTLVRLGLVVVPQVGNTECMDFLSELPPAAPAYTRIGYARVSTEEQSLDVQVRALEEAGCKTIYRDKWTGANCGRPGLKRLMAFIRPLDVVVVTKLDRFARSTADLLNLVADIDRVGAALFSLAEPWVNTSSPAGKLIVTIFAGVAEFERQRILERCNEGRTAALARGVKFGAPPVLSPERKRKAAELLAAGEHVDDVALVMGVSRSTMYRVKRGITRHNGIGEFEWTGE